MSEGHTGVSLQPREVPAQPSFPLCTSVLGSLPCCRRGESNKNFRVLLFFLRLILMFLGFVKPAILINFSKLLISSIQGTHTQTEGLIEI